MQNELSLEGFEIEKTSATSSARDGQLAKVEPPCWPELIASLQGKAQVSLQYKGITDLPMEFAALTEIRELNLSSNPLKRFPNVLLLLPKLEVLHIDNTGVSAIPPDFHPSGLRVFTAGRNALSSVPDALFTECRHLQVLHLHQNQFSSIPDSLGRAVTLEDLDLSYNRLQTIPGNIGNLSGLQKLSLQGNLLAELPETVGELRGLRQLALYENKLTALPLSVGQLEALQVLDVSRNELRALPASIGGWKALRWLVLSENKLESLPASFCKLDRLPHCFLEGNQLSDLPSGAPDSLCSLGFLSKAHNPFPAGWALPESFRKARLLEEGSSNRTK